MLLKQSEKGTVMKKKIVWIIGIIVAITVITVISLYVTNEDVRDWMDEYIFRKNIIDEDLPTISIENENASIYAYDNHIKSKCLFNI